MRFVVVAAATKGDVSRLDVWSETRDRSVIPPGRRDDAKGRWDARGRRVRGFRRGVDVRDRGRARPAPLASPRSRGRTVPVPRAIAGEALAANMTVSGVPYANRPPRNEGARARLSAAARTLRARLHAGIVSRNESAWRSADGPTRRARVCDANANARRQNIARFSRRLLFPEKARRTSISRWSREARSSETSARATAP
jgi:hypothetical protein